MSNIDLRVESVLALSAAEGWWIEVEYRKFQPLVAFAVLQILDDDGVLKGVPVPLTAGLLSEIRDALAYETHATVAHSYLLNELRHRSEFISEGKLLHEDV